MTDEQTITRKEFPNGDVALDEGEGLVYRTRTLLTALNLICPNAS